MLFLILIQLFLLQALREGKDDRFGYQLIVGILASYMVHPVYFVVAVAAVASALVDWDTWLEKIVYVVGSIVATGGSAMILYDSFKMLFE